MRGSFLVETLAEARAVVRALGAKWTAVISTARRWCASTMAWWARSQLWPPATYRTSKAGGHKADRAGRSLAPTDPRRLQADAEQRAFFTAAAAALPDGIRQIYDTLAGRDGQGVVEVDPRVGGGSRVG